MSPRANRRDELPLVRASTGTTPREIKVHIEELILHGFAPNARWELGDALEHELHGLLTAKGIPPAWFSNPERIDAGTTRATNLTKPTIAGTQIADAVYRGGGQ